MNEGTQKTARHYSKQWGGELDFKSFVKANPDAAKAMPSRQLPWGELFERIRLEAAKRIVTVYDAACGFGDVLQQLTAEPNPRGLKYLGCDIHDALGTIERPENAEFMQWDITGILPGQRTFDFIICRAAIHHTPDPEATFRVLASQLAPGGTIAITAYAKKSLIRESVDETLRNHIVPMTTDDAFTIANQFTKLGRDLQSSDGFIVIAEDLPFLSIKAGRYRIQEFIYKYFIKCWYNEAFDIRHCDLVNFDWYHPPYAYRYEPATLDRWATGLGLHILNRASIEAQHYLEAERRDEQSGVENLLNE
ncbi:MAG: class I SAM-dependent methyltransferase [Rhodospirillaceae bacterium]